MSMMEPVMADDPAPVDREALLEAAGRFADEFGRPKRSLFTGAGGGINRVERNHFINFESEGLYLGYNIGAECSGSTVSDNIFLSCGEGWGEVSNYSRSR